MATPPSGSSIAADLQVLDQRHRLLAESANDVIWTMSVTGEITYVSPSVEAMRGITPEQAVAQELHEIQTPESVAITLGYFAELHAALAEGRRPPDNFRGELEYYRADGSTVWCDAQVIPVFDDDGALVEILGVSRDIDQRKRAEQAVAIAREEAEQARVEAVRERARRDERQRLAHDMHDDLLQALAAVGAHIGMAVEGVDAADDRTLRHLRQSRADLALAMESARRLVQGDVAPALEDADLPTALARACDVAAGRYGIEVVFECPSRIAASCSSDVAEALLRVTQEALGNAGRHAGATVVRVTLDDAPDGMLELRVADDGRGLPGERRSGATGIDGMARRMQALGGALEVGAAEPAGTEVAARVPASALQHLG